MQQQVDVCYRRWASRADSYIDSLYGQEPHVPRGEPPRWVWRAILPLGKDGVSVDPRHSAIRSLVQFGKDYLAHRRRGARVAEHAAWIRAMRLVPRPAEFRWSAVPAQERKWPFHLIQELQLIVQQLGHRAAQVRQHEDHIVKLRKAACDG